MNMRRRAITVQPCATLQKVDDFNNSYFIIIIDTCTDGRPLRRERQRQSGRGGARRGGAGRGGKGRGEGPKAADVSVNRAAKCVRRSQRAEDPAGRGKTARAAAALLRRLRTFLRLFGKTASIFAAFCVARRALPIRGGRPGPPSASPSARSFKWTTICTTLI